MQRDLPCASVYHRFHRCVVLLALVGIPGCSENRPDQAMRAAESASQPIEQSAQDPLVVEQYDSDIAAESIAAERVEHEPEIAYSMEMESSLYSANDSQALSQLRTRRPEQIDSLQKTRSTGPFSSLPAGATHDTEKGYATIAVYYATDRQRAPVPLSAYNITGNRDAFILLGGSAIVFLAFSGLNLVRRRAQVGIGFAVFGVVSAVGAMTFLLSGNANIEKRGVKYNAQRGALVKGIAEVTVPDTHKRGAVERPSLLRFEIREDQQEHVVLTSAVELSDVNFKNRLAETVAFSPNQDMLVFVHGYNVDFESAIQRTAQVAVDLPFEGVPVCYSWPSQGTLFGYTVDETNAAWTQTHLKQFLLDLARDSGARSINVVAHSMGNRPTTGAIAEIGRDQRQSGTDNAALFDRLVLAAPDIDADRFRRDLAPELTSVTDHVTLYASSDDRALIASKQVHGSPRAGESGDGIVVVPGIDTVDVSGIDLTLLGHSYYGEHPWMLQDLYQVVRNRLPATERRQLAPRTYGDLTYWQLIGQPSERNRVSAELLPVR